MSINARQFQNLQAEACRMAEQLPRTHLLDSLIAACEAGRLLHLTRSSLIGLLRSVLLRSIDDQTDPPAPGARSGERAFLHPPPATRHSPHSFYWPSTSPSSSPSSSTTC